MLYGTVHWGIVIKFEISLVSSGDRVTGPPTITLDENTTVS